MVSGDSLTMQQEFGGNAQLAIRGEVDALYWPSLASSPAGDSGIRAKSVAPLPGVDSMVNVPPTSATRSRIPTRPNRREVPRELIAASASKPQPSSSTMASTWSGEH